MTFRRVLFWMHLIAGVAAGLVIFLMSATGVLLTYERQITSAIQASSVDRPATGEERLSVDQLAQAALLLSEGDDKTTLVLDRHKRAPIVILAGRRTVGILDPYTGEVIEDRSAGAQKFFSFNRGLHRWLAQRGEARKTGKMITGISNLLFLFIVLSGLYLWWPRVWKWPLLRHQIAFQSVYPTSKARDFNWHHVFGFWFWLPLLVVVLSATVFSYGWAGKALGQAAEKFLPSPLTKEVAVPAREGEGEKASLEALVAVAQSTFPDWKQIRLPALSPEEASTILVRVDRGYSGEAMKRTSLTMDLMTTDIVATAGFSDMAPARRARIFNRYLHTGEIFGLWGQTLAGLASLAACFLVYTGLALAFRRLILKPRRMRSSRAPSNRVQDNRV